MPHAKPYPTLADLPAAVIENFWSRVNRGQPDECWLWNSGCDGKGYGAFYCAGRVLIAPRFAWVLTHGFVQQELSVRHRCDNPPCCNPSHLLLGTHKENMDDRDTRGRMPHYRGSQNVCAKLTDEQVAEARRLHADGCKSAELGRRFGLSQSSMSRVLRGLSYRLVNEAQKESR